jgi:glutamine amidotransferase
MTVALIDYGAGNLQSVRNALKAAGAGDICVTDDPDIVARADRIILPGVGAFAACMGALEGIDGMTQAMMKDFDAEAQKQLWQYFAPHLLR